MVLKAIVASSFVMLLPWRFIYNNINVCQCLHPLYGKHCCMCHYVLCVCIMLYIVMCVPLFVCMSLQVFSNCSCVGVAGNFTASTGQCPHTDDCDRMFPYFLALSVITSFIISLGGTPGYMILIRSAFNSFIQWQKNFVKPFRVLRVIKASLLLC